MTRVTNREATAYIERMEFFKGSNIFGYWAWSDYPANRNVPRREGVGPNALYIVTSFGNHFPMLVFDRAADKWFHNTDRYSPTTSRHQARAGRLGQGMTTEQLQAIIQAGGVADCVGERIDGLLAA